jgi:hypothetical protein
MNFEVVQVGPTKIRDQETQGVYEVSLRPTDRSISCRCRRQR